MVSLLIVPLFCYILHHACLFFCFMFAVPAVVMVMFERITYTVDEGDTIFATVLLSLASTETVSVDVASSADTATGEFITIVTSSIIYNSLLFQTLLIIQL